MKTGLRNGLLLALSVVVLVGGYVVAQKAGAPASEPAPATAAQPASAAVLPQAPRPTPPTFRIDVGQAQAGAATVYQLRQDEQAEFVVSSPRDGMLEIHGYTEGIALKAGQETRFPLQAAHTGRFPVHVHGKDGGHAEVGVLEVLPKP